MNDFVKNNIPLDYQDDILKAVEILKKSSVEEIYIFGSLAQGTSKEESDIDLAIKGCKPEYFFRVYGELLMNLNHSIDLINLDRDDDFSIFISEKGKMISVN